MQLLLNTYKCNEDFDGFGYALLDLTPNLAERILKRAAAFKELHEADSNLESLTYWDYGPSYLSRLPNALENLLDRNAEFVEVQCSLEEVESLSERTECNKMIICNAHVFWETVPKHTDVRVETRAVDYATVESVLRLVHA